MAISSRSGTGVFPYAYAGGRIEVAMTDGATFAVHAAVAATVTTLALVTALIPTAFTATDASANTVAAKARTVDVRQTSRTIRRRLTTRSLAGQDRYVANGGNQFTIEPPDQGAQASGRSTWLASEYIAQTCTFEQFLADYTCGEQRGLLGNWSTRLTRVDP